MSVEKKPLTEIEFIELIARATEINQEYKMIILILGYTGMHVSVLAKPRIYDLHIKDHWIVWDRTKKRGKDAYTSVPIPSSFKEEEFKEFIESLYKRKKKKSRQYFYNVVKECGKRIGIRDLSPMSLRHTLGVRLFNIGFASIEVQQILNCSEKTLRAYGKHTKKTIEERFKKIGW